MRFTCFHEAPQRSLHHCSSAVDVLLLRLQSCQLAQHILTGVLQALTTNPITHTHAHNHPWTYTRQWQTVTKRGRGGNRKNKQKKRVKRLESGQKNWKTQDVNEECSIFWKFLDRSKYKRVFLAVISHVNDVIWLGSEGQRNWETFERGTHNWPVFLLLVCQAGGRLCSAALHTWGKKKNCKRKREVQLISKTAQTLGSHLCYERFLRLGRSLHLQPGQEKQKSLHLQSISQGWHISAHKEYVLDLQCGFNMLLQWKLLPEMKI